MKKQVNPAIIVIAVVVAIGIVGFLFYKGTAAPEAVHMDPLGPAGKLLRAGGGAHGMTPDVQAAQQNAQQNQAGAAGKQP